MSFSHPERCSAFALSVIKLLFYTGSIIKERIVYYTCYSGPLWPSNELLLIGPIVEVERLSQKSGISF